MKKRIVTALLLGVVLTGCGSKEQLNISDTEESSVVESAIGVDEEEESLFPEIRLRDESTVTVDVFTPADSFYLSYYAGSDASVLILNKNGDDLYMAKFPDRSETYLVSDSLDGYKAYKVIGEAGDILADSGIDLASYYSVSNSDVESISNEYEQYFINNKDSDTGMRCSLYYDEEWYISRIERELLHRNGVDAVVNFYTGSDISFYETFTGTYLSDKVDEISYKEALSLISDTYDRYYTEVIDSLGIVVPNTDIESGEQVEPSEQLLDEETGFTYFIDFDGVFIQDDLGTKSVFIQNGEVISIDYIDGVGMDIEEFKVLAIDLANRVYK